MKFLSRALFLLFILVGVLIAVSNSQPVQLGAVAAAARSWCCRSTCWSWRACCWGAGRSGDGLVGGRHHRRRARGQRARPRGSTARMQRLRESTAGQPARRSGPGAGAARTEGDRTPERAGGTRALSPSSARPLRVEILSAAEVDASLDDLALIDRLDALFRTGCEMPPRHHHAIASRRCRLGRCHAAADAGLDARPVGAYRRQDRHGLSRQRPARRCPRSTASTFCSTARPAVPGPARRHAC